MPNTLASGEATSHIGLYRVPGEDAPWWLAGGFATVGLLMALAAAYVLTMPPILASQSAHARSPIAYARPAPKPLAQLTPTLLRQAPSAPKEAADEVSQVRPTKREVVCLPVVSIAFPYKSAQPILEGVQAQLEPLLKWLKVHPDAMLLVEGHADPTGGEVYNLMLSYSRALAIISWLADFGLERRRMTPLAAGTAQTIIPARVVADNRMAVLQVAGATACQGEGAQKQ